jgi:hypothetical protein
LHLDDACALPTTSPAFFSVFMTSGKFVFR